MERKTAVVLFNLGGPDSLDAVEPFLYNLFSDPDIFRLPLAFLTQRVFARLLSRRRVAPARAGYAAIGGKSPLLDNTRRQAEALQRALQEHGPFEVFICMRYWNPRATEVVSRLKDRGHTHVVLMPLYPQYSVTTTGSSYNEFMRECERQNYRAATRLIRQWHDAHDYQQAIISSISAEIAKFPDPDPAHVSLLFSAHGLPQKIVDRGDPYEQQIRATFEALNRQLGWPDVTLCYQSRVGPLKWLQPYTDDVIREKGRGGVRQLLIYPIAFVSDHTETLYELGILYRKVAADAGIEHYRVAPALNDDPLLIRALERLILAEAKQL
ncbi:MAG: ferrochelatase [Gammaproteobacteria bacterium]|nr:ferrochelatase [Gammaproteobacteria bacterium]